MANGAQCPLSGVKRTCRFALQMSAFDPKRTLRCWPAPSGASSEKRCGAERPRTWLLLQVADYAYAACGPQIFILRVSGIKNRLSTKHTAGTAIG